MLSGKRKTGGSKDKLPLQNHYLCHSGAICSCDFKHISVPPFLVRIVSYPFSIDLGRTYNVLKKEQQDEVNRLRLEQKGLS